MYCPNCGSHQSEGRKFCTVCGTNLSLVSHALSGHTVQAPPPPVVPPVIELERQREMSKGVRLTILGSGFFFWGILKLIISGPFRPGPPFGIWMFIGFILLAYGVSKLISFRTAEPKTPDIPISNMSVRATPTPRPVFSEFRPGEYVTPRTSELEPARPTTPSVTEEETQQLPRGQSTRR